MSAQKFSSLKSVEKVRDNAETLVAIDEACDSTLRMMKKYPRILEKFLEKFDVYNIKSGGIEGLYIKEQITIDFLLNIYSDVDKSYTCTTTASEEKLDEETKQLQKKFIELIDGNILLAITIVRSPGYIVLVHRNYKDKFFAKFIGLDLEKSLYIFPIISIDELKSIADKLLKIKIPDKPSSIYINRGEATIFLKIYAKSNRYVYYVPSTDGSTPKVFTKDE